MTLIAPLSLQVAGIVVRGHEQITRLMVNRNLDIDTISFDFCQKIQISILFSNIHIGTSALA